MLQVSESASEAIRAIISEKSIEGPLRVYLANGCGGMQLGLTPDAEKDGDETFELDGVTYLVSDHVSSQTGDIKVDYINNEYSQGFSLTPDKPLAPTSGCAGCTSC